MTIKLNTLEICSFDKNDSSHLCFLKKLVKDQTVLSRFQGFTHRLLHHTDEQFFGRGFLISKDSKIVGYVDIGNFNVEEENVYLRCAIDDNERGKGVGKTLLKELTFYIFQNYQFVDHIKLKIAHDNVGSLKIAESCGYVWINQDYYIKQNLCKQIKRSI